VVREEQRRPGDVQLWAPPRLFLPRLPACSLAPAARHTHTHTLTTATADATHYGAVTLAHSTTPLPPPNHIPHHTTHHPTTARPL